MNSLWYLYDSGLSDELCSEVLSNWNDITARQGKVGDAEITEQSHIRSSKIIKCPYGSPLQENFAALLDKYVNVANRECFGFDLNGFSEFQIAEYDKGDYYIEHLDTSITDKESHRKLSITVQLTNPSEYEGGDFAFGVALNNPDRETLRKKGAILVFPSFLPHSIQTVKEGKRHALVGWYEGKKWC